MFLILFYIIDKRDPLLIFFVVKPNVYIKISEEENLKN